MAIAGRSEKANPVGGVPRYPSDGPRTNDARVADQEARGSQSPSSCARMLGRFTLPGALYRGKPAGWSSRPPAGATRSQPPGPPPDGSAARRALSGALPAGSNSRGRRLRPGLPLDQIFADVNPHLKDRSIASILAIIAAPARAARGHTTSSWRRQLRSAEGPGVLRLIEEALHKLGSD